VQWELLRRLGRRWRDLLDQRLIKCTSGAKWADVWQRWPAPPEGAPLLQRTALIAVDKSGLKHRCDAQPPQAMRLLDPTRAATGGLKN
jgi:hypothetical protein